MFSRVLAHVTFPAAEECQRPNTHSDCGLARLFNFIHSNGCVLPSRDFNSHFPIVTSFHKPANLACHLCIFLSEVSVQIFRLVFNWVVLLSSEFCVYSGYKSFCQICVCKYLLLVYGLPFHKCLWKSKVFNFYNVQFIDFLIVPASCVLVYSFSVAAITNDDKCILSQFLRPEVPHQFHWAETKAPAGLHSLQRL